jgi:hypothetical protein
MGDGIRTEVALYDAVGIEEWTGTIGHINTDWHINTD